MRARFVQVSIGVTVLASLGIAACYRPNPQGGSFTCSVDLGGLCPNGLICSPQGLCVEPRSLDMARVPFDLGGDLRPSVTPRTCEQLVAQGAFANLVPLATANTSDDEGHIALDPSGDGRLLFQRGNQFFVAAFVAGNPKALLAPQAVTLTGGPATLHGGSFTNDGKLWFAGSNGGTTSLYSASPVGDHEFAVDAARAPVTSGCPFSDPVFSTGDASKDLFASYALAGCSGKPYLVQGRADRNIQAFYSGLVDSGWSSPSLSSTGLGLVVASTDGPPRLYAASRSATNTQFSGAGRIGMTGLGGDGIEDRQLVVSADCRTLYLSSVRTGGMGAGDLYAADILPE